MLIDSWNEYRLWHCNFRITLRCHKVYLFAKLCSSVKRSPSFWHVDIQYIDSRYNDRPIVGIRVKYQYIQYRLIVTLWSRVNMFQEYLVTVLKEGHWLVRSWHEIDCLFPKASVSFLIMICHTGLSVYDLQMPFLTLNQSTTQYRLRLVMVEILK